MIIKLNKKLKTTTNKLINQINQMMIFQKRKMIIKKIHKKMTVKKSKKLINYKFKIKNKKKIIFNLQISIILLHFQKLIESLL